MALKSIRRLAGHVGLARDMHRLRRADSDAARQAARAHLVQRLGKMRGVPQKVGQILSFTDSPDRQDAADDFAVLRESAEPLALDRILPLLEDAWNRPARDVLGDIDPVGRAASLGQVHRARLRDGTSVAVKVQYPGIREAVRSDLNLLGWLSAPVGNLRRGFDMRAYRRVLRQCLDEELDYRHEADNQAAFFRFAGEEPGLAVPELFPELVTETVLVSSWEDGDDWDTVRAKWTVDEKRRLAEELLAVFLRGIFDRGMMHADWHPGNVRFRRGGRSPQVLLYDFGCVLRMPRQQSDALLRLIRATMREDESPWPPMIALGFDREFLEPIAAKLPALCRVLFEPFLVEYRYDLADWRLAERVGDILGDDRWNFRIAGPADLILLLRAWHGATY